MIKRELIQLYQFQDFNTEKFIELYLQEISEREEIEEINMLGGQCTYRTIKAHVGVRKPELIISKFEYLQDTIIRLANSKKEDKSFSVSSSVLKAVIGKEYKPMLNVLIRMGYIEQGNGNYGSDKHFYYEIGAYSKMYLMKDVPIHCWYGTNAAVQKYRDKAAAMIAAYQENIVHTSFDNRYGSSFRKQYLISLNYFHLEDEERLGQFIKQGGYDKDTAPEYVYYRDILAKLEDKKEIYSVDRNGRIYHVLCNLSKELKDYINIDFSLDCKNSHPLLLNSFIFKSHNISVDSSAFISEFLSGYVPVKELYPAPQQHPTPYIYHNVGKNLRKALNSNNIESASVANLTNDELEYIYLTSKGALWDTINELHPQFSRKEIKEKFFTEVLYSKTSSTANKPFAKEFVAMFPSVYNLICSWKQPSKDEDISDYLTEHHLYSGKEHAALSIALMNLEAQIFTDILKRLYAKRWCAVNIHDCIVVPKTGKKNHPQKEPVRQIMQDVFATYGLSPTFD